MPLKLDAIDRSILRTLQAEGRLQNTDLADRVGLSPSPCLRRVRILEEAGIILGYAARLDAAKIGAGLTVFARVWLNGADKTAIDTFVAAVEKLPQILECHMLAGDCDFLLKVVVADLDAYRRFRVEQLGRISGIRDIKTDIPMQTLKQTSALPLEPS